MELRDFIVTPLLLIIVYVVAFWVRPLLTDHLTRRYFIPGLSFRIIGALAVGFIYQFYYGGGDTFAYHTHGSRHIWNAFMEDPTYGLKLMMSDGTFGPGIWAISDQIWYWRDPQSMFVIKIAAVLDFFTFSSYSGTAVLFAVISFIGGWMLFLTFYKIIPELHKWIAFSTLFIPTVVFWGSGIYKDSITLAFLGISTYCFHQLFMEKKVKFSLVVILLVSFWIIFSIKKYILLTFIPALLIWWFAKQLGKIRHWYFKVVVIPPVAVIAGVFIYFAVFKISEGDAKYNVGNLANTARITAYDIRYGWGARLGETSGYSLGELDGSWQRMLRLAPAAINVSLFRPYLWEVKNPLMLLSSLESFFFLICTLVVLIKVRTKAFRLMMKPHVLFCVCFALVFAFAVGIATYNFGTLSRYKIPLLPFYMLAIGMIHHYWKSERKTEVLDSLEYF